MRLHSRLRFIFLCLFGFRHRKGEHWFRVEKGVVMQKTNRCTRCGVRSPGVAW